MTGVSRGFAQWEAAARLAAALEAETPLWDGPPAQATSRAPLTACETTAASASLSPARTGELNICLQPHALHTGRASPVCPVLSLTYPADSPHAALLRRAALSLAQNGLRVAAVSVALLVPGRNECPPSCRDVSDESERVGGDGGRAAECAPSNGATVEELAEQLSRRVCGGEHTERFMRIYLLCCESKTWSLRRPDKHPGGGSSLSVESMGALVNSMHMFCELGSGDARRHP